MNFVYRLSQNCFYKLRRVIVPIQMSNNYQETQSRIFHSEGQKRKKLGFLYKRATVLGKQTNDTKSCIISFIDP